MNNHIISSYIYVYTYTFTYTFIYLYEFNQQTLFDPIQFAMHTPYTPLYC